MVLCIVVASAALPMFFVFVRILVAGGASALVLDLVWAAGLVAFGVVCAATTLCCLRYFRLRGIVLVVCIGGVSVGFSVGLENARLICRVAISSDCAIDRVSRWAGSVRCTLRTDWVPVWSDVRTLGIDGVVLFGAANELAMLGCWWMACSVSSTSCLISSVPLKLVMLLIAFAQSAIAFMTLSVWVMVGLVMCL
jgi:hypothetical protein